MIILYRFDKKLHLQIFNEFNKIDVAVRSAIVYISSDIMDAPFLMPDYSNFINNKNRVPNYTSNIFIQCGTDPMRKIVYCDIISHNPIHAFLFRNENINWIPYEI
ncbi:MAG: Abi family protein [Prevotella sp.]|nr:Abi family protein [Prevotella sp.]